MASLITDKLEIQKDFEFHPSMAQIIVPENLALKKIFQKIIKEPLMQIFTEKKSQKKVKDSALGYITKLDGNFFHITPIYKADQHSQRIPVKTITKTGIPLPLFPKKNI